MSNSYSPRLVRSVIAFASVIMLVFLAITAVNAWTSYKTALSDAEMRAQTTADLLRQQVQTTIKISQLVVDSMVTHGQKERIEGNHVGISHDHHLMYMASHLPFSPWLVEIDANGRQRYMQKTRESNSDPAPTALKNTVEHSSAPHTPHSGSIGLAISHRFVEMMGGRITVDSELGAGSCFTVWLPDFAITNQDSVGTTSGPRLLVIEDTLTDISLLERYLISFGYRIEVARNGEQGLARARQITPSAIILDLELPGMDGFEVLKTLAADKELRSIPVIVTTAHGACDPVLELGARGYVTKPIDRHVLQAALNANIPRRKRDINEAATPVLAYAADG